MSATADGLATAGVLAVEPLGDAGWLLRLGTTIDPACNRRVHALARRLADGAPAALRDIVPAYASIALLYRPGDALARATLRRWIDSVLALAAAAEVPVPGAAPALVEIPVHYDGEDLPVLAAHARIGVAEVVRLHTAPTYTVAMLGFAPGFPYLLGLDPRLAMPRLPTPRAAVPVGSVAVAELQTGIYPQGGPGGWRLLGHTDARLFDAGNAARPALLQPGDRVRFRAA